MNYIKWNNLILVNLNCFISFWSGYNLKVMLLNKKKELFLAYFKHF